MKINEVINETSLNDIIKWKAGVEISKKLPGWRPSDMWKKDEYPNLDKVGNAPTKSDNQTKPKKRKQKRPTHQFSLPKVTQPRTSSSISGDKFDASGKPFKESTTVLERREADLYHSTQEYEEILNSGFIEPMENEEDLETGADDKPAISLTRDKNMNIFGPVQFVIDQTKLANTHKIKPIDAVFTRWGDGEDELERRSESEERVYKPIPISYIKAIRIVEPEYVDIEDIVELAAKHNLPVIDVNDNPVTENLSESPIKDIYSNFKNVNPKERVHGIQKYLMQNAGPINKNGKMYWKNIATRQIFSINDDKKFMKSIQQAAAKLSQTLFTTMEESATAGATSASNIATVTSVPAAYRKVKRDKNGIPKAPQALNKDGTAKNAIDTGLNLMGGKPIKR